MSSRSARASPCLHSCSWRYADERVADYRADRLPARSSARRLAAALDEPGGRLARAARGARGSRNLDQRADEVRLQRWTGVRAAGGMVRRSRRLVPRRALRLVVVARRGGGRREGGGGLLTGLGRPGGNAP